MCTAMSITTGDRYFGRNLDLDFSYGEEVCVVPRNLPFHFRMARSFSNHYAMIGMALVMDGVPLFYDAANEHGLCMAGLNFPGNAWYAPPAAGKINIAPFELIPWVLCQCRDLPEAKKLLRNMNLADIAFSDSMPPTPLHWFLSDLNGSAVLECRHSGMYLYDDPVEVLTNNPPFEYQLENWRRYGHLRNDNAHAAVDDSLPYSAYSQGLGAVGLPGDVSSMSRFVRTAFGVQHSVCLSDEASAVGQVFHLLASAEMVRGLCRTDDGTWDVTLYSACINATHGRYYYTTYDNRSITCVDMHHTDLNGSCLYPFPLKSQQRIFCEN